MWEFFESILSENFDKIFFGVTTLIIVGAALLDIRDKNHPPGPMGIPFLGYLPFLNKKSPYKNLMDLTNQYGRIYGVQLGSVYAVVVADVKLIKEILSRQDFQSQAPLYLTYGINPHKGMKGRDEENWKEQREFASLLLKNIGQENGLQKIVIQNEIQESVREFIQDIRCNLGDEQDINSSLRNSIGMMMMGIILGGHYDRNDPDWIILQEIQEENSKLATITSVLNYIPLLRKIPSYAKPINRLITGRKKSQEIYKNFLDKQSKSVNPINVQSLFDAYLIEVINNKNDKIRSFTNEQIQQVLSDLVSDGWESSLATLKWLYLYMAIYPEIQENVAKEVKSIVGEKAEVGLDDLKNLPYTEATILEIWRHQTIVPLGVPIATKEKTKLGDYTIPKNSMIMGCLWAVHHDPRLWEKPEIFSPERFLYEDGCIFRNENLMPFQTGNSMLIGEELSQWAIKLFFANTIKEFQIGFPKGFVCNITEVSEFGTTLVPKSYPLLLLNR